MQDLLDWHIGRVRQISTIYLFAKFMQSDVVGELVEPHHTTDFRCDICVSPIMDTINKRSRRTKCYLASGLKIFTKTRTRLFLC
jgi:hypothetical protein